MSLMWSWSMKHEHIWLPVLLIVGVVVQAYRAKRKPNLYDVSDLIAYGAGLYGAAWVLYKASKMDSDGVSWAMSIGSLLAILAMVPGFWRVWLAFGPAGRRQDPSQRSDLDTRSSASDPSDARH